MARALVALAFCAFAIASCGLFSGSALEGRAADFYNYMVGKKPGAKYSSYLSPAYRKSMGKQGVRSLDEAKSIASQPNTRYPDAKAEDISVSREGNFAFTLVRRELGDAFSNLPPQKWVKDGMKWYIYMGTDAEEKKYGPWPAALSPREAPGSE